MKNIALITTLFLSTRIFSAIEILDRIAVIVDDGVVMESQIKAGLDEIIARYDQVNDKSFLSAMTFPPEIIC